MPTAPRPENGIIRLFVSAYENDSWKDSTLTFPDESEDGGIDGFAEKADGTTLAIEHTVVEPFVGDILDQSEFIPEFRPIENDKSLHVPDVWIRLFVPVKTLHLQKRPVRAAILRCVTEWLRTNRLSLPKGDSKHRCPIIGISGKPDFDIELTLQFTPLAGEGTLHVRRQQVEDTFGEVIEKMLRKKPPKLVKTVATKRILLLERRHPNLHPDSICREIENRRAQFPELAEVHEIWIVETASFFPARDGDACFELWEGGEIIRSFDFDNGQLISRSEDGMPLFLPR